MIAGRSTLGLGGETNAGSPAARKGLPERFLFPTWRPSDKLRSNLRAAAPT